MSDVTCPSSLGGEFDGYARLVLPWMVWLVAPYDRRALAADRRATYLRILSSAPQSSIEHHRRLRFLLSSTNTKRHEAQPLTRSRGPSVTSFSAAWVMGQSGRPRSWSSAQLQRYWPSAGTSRPWERASASSRCSRRRSA